MKVDPNAPAMPSSVSIPEITDASGRYTPAYTHLNPGLTIRAHLAAMAMQGLLANPHGLEYMAKSGKDNSVLIAQDAVVFADALIAEMNK